MKTRTSLFVIGILIAMLAASLLTVLALFLTGTLAPNKPLLEFSVKQIVAKEYDGTPLTAANGDLLNEDGAETDEEVKSRFYWVSGSNNLKEGHKVEGRFYGSQTDVGVSDSDLRVKIYDEKDRDVTGEYSIKVNNCELRVLKKAITVVLQSQQIQYSGKELPIENYKIYRGSLTMITPDQEEAELVSGQKLMISFPGKFENVGDKLPAVNDWKSENFKIYDLTGNDVTKNYYITKGMVGNGTIEIVPRIIKVKALDAEKYYDGTPIAGKYEVIGSLAEGEYIGEVEFEDRDGNALSADVGTQKVRVANIAFYKQDGYTVVPAENYIWESDDDEVIGTFTVNARPVTVRAKDIVKIYDGEPLSGEFVADLTLKGYEVEGILENDNIINVCNGVYSFTGATVKKDGVNVTNNFTFHYEKARVTILPIQIQFRLKSPAAQTYNGEVIKIPLADALNGLQNSISEYILVNELGGKEIAGILEGVTNTDFQEVCARTIKNADTYSFSAELSDEAVQKFGNRGNVIFEFSEGQFKVEPARIRAQYNGNEADGSVSKIYDGKEAKSALDSSNVVLEEFNKIELSVVSASFKYNDMNVAHVKCGTYPLTGNVVKIISFDSEDVSQNFTVEPFAVSVKVEKRTISAKPAESVINYSVNSSAEINYNKVGEIVRDLYASISFEGLAEGDRVGKTEDDFELYYTLKDSTATVYVDSLFHVYNSKGDDVADCYEFKNDDEAVLITICFTVV